MLYFEYYMRSGVVIVEVEGLFLAVVKEEPWQVELEDEASTLRVSPSIVYLSLGCLLRST